MRKKDVVVLWKWVYRTQLYRVHGADGRTYRKYPKVESIWRPRKAVYRFVQARVAKGQKPK